MHFPTIDDDICVLTPLHAHHRALRCGITPETCLFSCMNVPDASGIHLDVQCACRHAGLSADVVHAW